MNGIIIIDKPQGMTSHDVVSFLRRKTGVRRIGHSGTLDPMATGVLPVFIGRATRVIEYVGFTDGNQAKKYRCTMRLGITTDTLDIWGTHTNERTQSTIDINSISNEEIESTLKSFEGEGLQKPPMYSAVKVGGRKLYEYARAGKTPDDESIRERPISIKHIEIIEHLRDTNEVVFDIVCSKGVYVRTICDDAGKALGCGAVMSGLVRLASDGFAIENAVAISSLEDILREDIEALLLSPEDALACMPRADLDEEATLDFVNGRRTKSMTIIQPDTKAVCVYGTTGFLGIGVPENGIIKPHKVIK